MLLFAAGKECGYFNSMSAPEAIVETKRDFSLQNVCRNKIRKYKTNNKYVQIPSMPIPELMKKYLRCDVPLNVSESDYTKWFAIETLSNLSTESFSRKQWIDTFNSVLKMWPKIYYYFNKLNFILLF